MTDFRNLKIWQRGMDLVVEVYKISELLPSEEKYGLCSQITRAAVAIPSNIAEGSSRSSSKDFKHFLEISLGSAFELETQVLIIDRLNMIKINQLSNLLNSLNEEQKMINGYINSLKTSI